MSEQEQSTSRIACKPSTRDRLYEMLKGMGLRATYDDLLNVLVDVAQSPGESDFQTGRRLAPWLLDTPGPDDPKYKGRGQREYATPQVVGK